MVGEGRRGWGRKKGGEGRGERTRGERNETEVSLSSGARKGGGFTILQRLRGVADSAQAQVPLST
eukprot:4855116-Pyramimonas_sp.AAC.2